MGVIQSKELELVNKTASLLQDFSVFNKLKCNVSFQDVQNKKHFPNSWTLQLFFHLN